MSVQVCEHSSPRSTKSSGCIQHRIGNQPSASRQSPVRKDRGERVGINTHTHGALSLSDFHSLTPYHISSERAEQSAQQIDPIDPQLGLIMLPLAR